jgi:NSS family neurotransmitter:Na+ symporter
VTDKNNLKKRDGFASNLGIIAAAAGSAIGLGNLWKFPYVTGQYGGAAFILVYLLCIVLIGIPVMLSEMMLGRKAEANAITTFKKLAPRTPWFMTGVLGVAASFFILSFYAVVAGWILAYIVRAATGVFNTMPVEQIGQYFGDYIANPVEPIIWQFIVLAFTAFVVLSGIKNGIEKYSKILMPALFVIIIILNIRAITLPGAGEGLAFLFKPDFSKINGEAILAALGQAFFTLSLGMAIMTTYGSYIPRKTNLVKTAVQVTIADTTIAIMAGIAIFPAVFAFGFEPSEGAGLVFITLPAVFQNMFMGQFFSVLFFVLVAIAAITSTISLMEATVAYFSEEFNWGRKFTTILVSVALFIIGLPSALSNGGPLSDISIAGMNIFDFIDFTTANVFLPLTALFICIFVGWKMKTKDAVKEIFNLNNLNFDNEKPFTFELAGAYAFLTKFVAPVAIALVILRGLSII